MVQPPIRYRSTRGEAQPRDFEGVLLAGLAEDGGLFVPDSWPVLAASEWRAARELAYPELAARLLAPFTAGCFDEAELAYMAGAVYRGFDHPAIAPLRQLDRDRWLLELFHGPTLAFKDFAMQLLAAMFDAVLARRGETITILGATSGDTGAAAVKALAGKDRLNVVMLHPRGRVSDVQRRQMTTELSANVLNVAIDGTFDDCQDLVKELFADQAFRQRLRLSAVNSINWARVAAQIVYYAYAALRLGAPDRPIAFAVPTGNFGNVYAGWAATRLGLPIGRLLVATNSNDILARFLETGAYTRGTVVPTTSPSMDIQVASNFERLVLAMEGGEPAAVRERMAAFRATGSLEVSPAMLDEVRRLFDGGSCDESCTAATIAATWQRTGELVDPHTAVGLHVAGSCPTPAGCPIVTLATAHPAKFPEAVEAATGIRPKLPARYAHLLEAPERCVSLPNATQPLKSLMIESFS